MLSRKLIGGWCVARITISTVTYNVCSLSCMRACRQDSSNACLHKEQTCNGGAAGERGRSIGAPAQQGRMDSLPHCMPVRARMGVVTTVHVQAYMWDVGFCFRAVCVCVYLRACMCACVCVHACACVAGLISPILH